MELENFVLTSSESLLTHITGVTLNQFFSVIPSDWPDMKVIYRVLLLVGLP